MIKIAIADDHKIIREGIKAMLEQEENMEVVAEAINGKDLIRILPTAHIDLILMDIQMPIMDGLEATKIIAKNYTFIGILVLSMIEDQKQIYEIIEIGASGYILKTTGKEELIHAIKTVVKGQKYIGTDIALNLLNQIHQDYSQNQAMGEIQILTDESGILSDREMEVLALIAQGLTNMEISEKLFLSKRTVESHRQHLLEKTHTTNTASLIKYAVSKRLIR